MKKKTVVAMLLAGCMFAAFGCNGKDKEKELSLRSLDMSKYVTLGEYKGLTVENVETEVSDEEVQNSVDNIVKNNIGMLGITDKEVKKGDKIVCDLRCYVDGIAVKSAESLGEVFVVGENDMRSEIDTGVVGMLPGESKKIEVSFGEDEASEELAGKDAILLVKVNAIFPDKLTDDMVKNMNNSMYSTVDQLYQSARNNLEVSRSAEAKQELQYNLVMAATDNASFAELPAEYKQDQIKRLNDKYEYSCGLAGIAVEDYVQGVYGMSIEELADNYLKQRMLIEAIAQKEDISYSDKEYRDEINANAKMQGVSVENYFLLNNLVDNEEYIEKLTFDKVVAIIYDNAVIN